jgi:hypothetical protein
MPYVNDDLVWGAENVDGGKICTKGNNLTRLVILSLWNELVVE